MKRIHLFGVLLASYTLQAQTLTQTTTTTNPSPLSYVIGQQGANSQVWQKVTQTIDAKGDVTFQTNQAYVELATGLNHLVNGQWVASSERINISPDGSSALATNGQHQAYFPGNIYSGKIKLVTPDGQTLQSEPIGLNYFDGTNSMLIAVVTNATGAILPSGNQVIYTNAFEGLNADLLYTYTKAGFEQDVILRQQPPDPSSLGLNPQTTRLQVLTEFFNPPLPSVTATTMPTAAGNLEDDYLGFGVMGMGRGKAFLLGNNSSPVEVNKQWLTLNGRQFLVEEVPIVSIASEIDSLPPFVTQTGVGLKPVVLKKLVVPPQRLTHVLPKATFLAKAMRPSSGLVLDYVTMTSQTNYTFKGDVTYYISGTVNLFGTNTFEGGAVIKYTNGASLNLLHYSLPLQINNLATAYRPVIFTAKDDNSVGQAISGSTGTPTNYYANPALEIGFATGQTLSNFRISYAQQAIYALDDSGVYFYNWQTVNCQGGLNVYYSSVYLRNVLFANIATNFNCLTQGTLDVQNGTFNNINYFYAETLNNAFSPLSVTNCILVNVSNLFAGTYTNTLSASTNGFYNCPPFGTGQVTNHLYPFNAVGAGYYYLTNGCAFTNAGTPNIDPTLLASLSQKTTHAPIIYSNTTFALNTVLSPRAQRDTNSSPDLGYHYDPLDYLCYQMSMYSEGTPGVTLTNGVAVGLYGNYGFVLNEICAFDSTGEANAMNRLVWYPSVQEQPVELAGISTVNSGIFNVSGATSTTIGIPKPKITLQFTDLPMLGVQQNFFYNGPTWTLNLNTVFLENCWLRGVSLSVSGWYVPYTNATTAVTLLNNLFERSTVSLVNEYSTYMSDIADDALALTAYNNLFWQSDLGLTYNDSNCWIHPAWTINDNLFDTSANSLGGNGSYTNYIGISNNGFYGVASSIGGTNNLTVTNLTYAASWLGSWYIGSSSPTLLYAGSRSASNAGLYDYTIQTSQVPDGTNTVSIGYHYPATDANGVPLLLELADPNNPGAGILTIYIDNPTNGAVIQ